MCGSAALPAGLRGRGPVGTESSSVAGAADTARGAGSLGRPAQQGPRHWEWCRPGSDRDVPARRVALGAELFPQDTPLPHPRDPIPNGQGCVNHTQTQKKAEPSTVPPSPFPTLVCKYPVSSPGCPPAHPEVCWGDAAIPKGAEVAARGHCLQRGPLLLALGMPSCWEGGSSPAGVGAATAPRGAEGNGGQVCQRRARKVINEHPAPLPDAPPSPWGPRGRQRGYRRLLPAMGAGGPGGTGPR